MSKACPNIPYQVEFNLGLGGLPARMIDSLTPATNYACRPSPHLPQSVLAPCNVYGHDDDNAAAPTILEAYFLDNGKGTDKPSDASLDTLLR